MTRLARHILGAQTNIEPLVAKIWHTYNVSRTTIAQFWQQLLQKQQDR